VHVSDCFFLSCASAWVRDHAFVCFCVYVCVGSGHYKGIEQFNQMCYDGPTDDVAERHVILSRILALRPQLLR